MDLITSETSLMKLINLLILIQKRERKIENSEKFKTLTNDASIINEMI